MKELRMENGSVVEARDAHDPHYLDKDTHIISSRGLYCPGDEVFLTELDGLEAGDDCPACGQVLQL